MENPSEPLEEKEIDDPYERIKQELQSMDDGDKDSDSDEYRIEGEELRDYEDEEQKNVGIEIDTKTDLLTVESLSKIMEEIATTLLTKYGEIDAKFRKEKLAHLENLETYIKIRRTYKTQIDSLIDQELNNKIQEYNLNNYFSQKTEEFNLLRSNLIQTLKLAICNPESEMNLEELKQLLTSQGNIIEREAKALITLKLPDMNVSEFRELIEERSLEICASKFGLQPEDIQNAIENSEAKELVLQIALSLANFTREYENSKSDPSKSQQEKCDTTKPRSPSHSPTSPCQSMKIEMDGDLISVQSLSDIYERTADLVLTDYITLTREYRTERRKKKDDLKCFVELKRAYLDKVDEAVNKVQAEFFKKIKFDEKIFRKSLSYYISDDNQDVKSLKHVLLEALNAAMPPTKVLGRDEVKELLQTQLKAVQKQMENIKELVFSVKNPDQLATLLEELVSDVVYQDHGCENEDIEASVKNYVEDAEIKELLDQISDTLTKLN